MNEALGRLSIDFMLQGNSGMTLEAWTDSRGDSQPALHVPLTLPLAMAK